MLCLYLKLYLIEHILSREYYLPWQSIRHLAVTPSFTQGRLLFVLIFNIYIGQSNYLKISSLGPPMVDPTPVSRSFAIIYLVARLLFEFLIFILELLIGLYANRKANLLVQQLSEHQRKRAIGEVWFANVNLCKSFL